MRGGACEGRDLQRATAKMLLPLVCVQEIFMLPAATEIQHCLPHGGGVCLGERSLASLHECAKGSDASAWPDHEHGCSQVARQLEAAATQPNRHSRRRRGTQLKACRTEACQEGRAHSEARRFKASLVTHYRDGEVHLPRACTSMLGEWSVSST